MKKLSFTFTFLFTFLLSFGQIEPYSIVINQMSEYGIQSYASCQDQAGSTLLVGEVLSSSGLVYKMDKYGELLWAESWNIPESNYNIQFTEVIPTNDNSFLISGFFNSSEGNRCILAKISENGDTIWTKTNTLGKPYSSFQTTDNGFIILGSKSVASPVFSQISLLKVDENGNYEWSKLFTINNKASEGYSIKQKSNGNYIMVGSFKNQEDYVDRGFISELNQLGEQIWSKSFINEVYNSMTEAHDFQIINDSIYILLNGYNSTILKTDSLGNIAWAKEFSGTSDYSPIDYGMRKLRKSINNDQLIFISGYTFSIYSVLDLNGNSLLSGWMEINAADIFSTEDNGLLVMGNGPLMGVKEDVWRYNTGLIQMGETGYGVDCVELSSGTSEEIAISSYDIEFEEQPGCEPISVDFELGSIDLTISEGCVDFIGGFEELNKNQIEIYPNPANHILQIAAENMQKGTFKIFALDGKLLKNYQSLTIPNQLDITDLGNGIYFYQFISPNNQLFNGKFTVLR